MDDDPTVRDSLNDVLLSEGYVVMPAENGQQALDLANQSPVDLVLLDLNMPVKNGWDTFEQFTREHPLIPIIIAMVDRELANPNDYQSESIGDYSRTTFGGLNATRSQRRAIMRILGIAPWSSQDAQVDIPLPPRRSGISDDEILGVL